MSIQEKFDKSIENIKQIDKLENEELLKLYGLYKQATTGDCNISCPMFWDLKGRAKWDAWNNNKGLSKEKSMRLYYKYVKEILKEKGINTDNELDDKE